MKVLANITASIGFLHIIARLLKGEKGNTENKKTKTNKTATRKIKTNETKHTNGN